MKTKQKNLRYRFFIIGIVLLFFLLVIFFFDGKIFEDDYNSPLVMLACTNPECELVIYESISENGTTTLVPIIKEHTVLWIRIIDNHKFYWTCSGGIEPVSLFGSNSNYVSNIKDSKSGYGNEMIFRLDYSDSFCYSSIVIKSDYLKHITNNTCDVRLPWLSQWFSNESPFIFNTSEELSFNDEKLISTKIDGEALFVPLFKSITTFPDLSLFDSAYEIQSICPEPLIIGAYFVWSEELFFTPILRYKVENDAVYDTVNEIILMIIGIAMSLGYEWIKNSFKLIKRDSTINDVNPHNRRKAK